MSSSDAPFVHEPDGVVVQGFEQRRRVEQGLADAVGADDREPVARQEHLGVDVGHRAQRLGPVLGVALHLLRVAAVRRRPDEQVARAQDAPRRHPHPGVVVGLAAGVVQLEALTTDVEIAARPVGLVGVAVLGRPLEVDQPELAPVDDRVVARGGAVAVEPVGDGLVRDDPRCRASRGPSLLLVPLDAEAWSIWPCVNTAVCSRAGVQVRSVSCTRSARNELPVSTSTRPSSVPNALTFANVATNALPVPISASSPHWRMGCCVLVSTSPLHNWSASSSTDAIFPLSALRAGPLGPRSLLCGISPPGRSLTLPSPVSSGRRPVYPAATPWSGW